MSNLTRYWHRKKFVLQSYLVTNPLPVPERTTVQTWLTTLLGFELPLEQELSNPAGGNGLLERRNQVLHPTPPPPPPAKARDRRSARLAMLVQAAVGGGPGKSGYFIGVADAHAAMTNYRNALKSASMAAADFLDAVNNYGQIKNIANALDVLLTTNSPAPGVFIGMEIRELVAAMRKAIARGGSGDGSAYWPSTVLSSSS